MPPVCRLNENDINGSNDFQQRQNGQHFPGELVVHGLVHIFVARSHYLGSARGSPDS